jgi:hypothetical protein
MRATTQTSDLTAKLELAAKRLYDAEIALHIARQTGIDMWVKAAADRMHEAIIAHRELSRRRAAQAGTHAVASCAR